MFYTPRMGTKAELGAFSCNLRFKFTLKKIQIKDSVCGITANIYIHTARLKTTSFDQSTLVTRMTRLTNKQHFRLKASPIQERLSK